MLRCSHLAVHFAARFPEKVSKLLLLCPAVCVPRGLPVLLQCGPIRLLFGQIVMLVYHQKYHTLWYYESAMKRCVCGESPAGCVFHF